MIGRNKDNKPFSMDEISKMAPETKKSVAEKLGKIIRETLDAPESAL